ncbi:MAG: hypothetical protein IPI67_37425 [Myxococcales bacterium]|nr:hypothetical protein [Myxococcales bacterium]
MTRRLWFVLLPLSCAAQRAVRADSEPGADRSLDAAITEIVSREQTPEAESRRLSQLGARWQPKTIGDPPPRERPVGRRALIDVRFADAELEEALRLLADAGGFALIADGELAGRVTADLRRVRPYEALVSLAEAHGARVERRGAIVVVTPR